VARWTGRSSTRSWRGIRRGESKGIVVYRLDRFARTLIGGYTALSELVEHGGEFASASEPQFDFTMPQGRLFLQLSLGMASTSAS